MKGNLPARALARARHRQRVMPDSRERKLREEARRERLRAMQRELDGGPFRVEGGER